MAKISRRAVASSTSAAAATSSSISTSQSNGNNIQYSGKPARADHSSKYAADGNVGTPSAATPSYLDPLRGLRAGEQFTTHTVPRGSYEFESSGSASTPFFSSSQITDADTSSPPFLQNQTSEADILAAERLRIRQEFFATYDVMTGVRIAATLGGFFGLMVFLIVWKSRSSSNETLKVLKDPKMAAVAAVCMQEEEERKIQEAMVATGMSIYPDEYDAILYRRQRMLSLGNVSAPPVLHRGYRFSSVGGGGNSSLLEPPRRFSYSYGGNLGSGLLTSGGRRKSGSESSRILSNYPMGSSFGMDDYFMETDDELDNGDYPDNSRRLLDLEGAHHKRNDSAKGGTQGLLAVPPAGYDSRRSSAMTCCSTESSYLERRCSAFTLGLGNLPPSLQRKLSTASRTSSTDNWDYYYPDIQVIQPTPKASPCPSERSTSDQLPSQATAVTTIKPTTKPTTSTTTTTTTTMKTAQKPTIAANGNGATSQPAPPTFVRKHSIAYYDPESAQAGRKQQIHSISADTVDLFPYNQAVATVPTAKVMQPATTGGGVHQSFHYNDSPTEELRLNVRRKIAVVELQRSGYADHVPTTFEHNNNSFPYSNSAAAIAAAAAAVANSSSLSMDSTPASMDKLNGSGSIGTAKNFFNAEKRAPLASLSSFKISSLEYQDSDMRSLDEDSVFLDSVADTDEDIQQFSSESEEASLGEPDVATIPQVIEAVAVETPAVLHANETLQKQVVEKRFSLGGPPTSNRPKRPLLQRHRTISASSSDRISLIGQQLKEFSIGQFISGGGSGTHTPTTLAESMLPLETHFGAVIATSSPPTHPRRAQLLQQYSDPQSLPTNTNTEEDTCSTLNTEVCAAVAGGAGTMTPQTHMRRSSSRCSPQSDGSLTSGNAMASQANTKQQLPRSRLADDPCASSISDSVISATPNTRQPIICVPSSLKNLIIRGSSSAQTEKLSSPTEYTRSATNLCRLEANDSFDYVAENANCPSVMLELPLIKLPTDESSDSSTASNDIEHSRSVSDESRDPSLPGSSRKWSRETLF